MAGGTAVAEEARERNGTFAALAIRDFRFLLVGTTLSNASQWIQQVTLGWLVYDMTGSGTILGSVNLARSAGSLSFNPIAAVAIDRLARRPLMLGVQGWLFAIALALGALLAFDRGEIWHLFVFALLGGVAQTFDLPLRQTAVFDLVPRRIAPTALALVQTGWSLMRSLGPAIGGGLILWFGPSGNFFIQATAHALIALNLFWIRFPPRSGGRRRGGMWSNLREGFAYIATQRTTRTFVMMGWVLPLFIIPTYTTLPPIFAKDVFHGGPETLGMLMSAVGLGGIAGGVFTASLGQFERRGLVQLAALLGTGVSLIGFTFSPTLVVALPLLVISGACEMVYLTTNQTLLQLSIPDEMRGRVTAIVTLNMVLSPLGSFFAGVGADLVGPRAIAATISGIAVVIAIVVSCRSSTVRDYRLSQAIRHPRD
ncbi:MAG: MFS transporter [Chloroflexi bacterium]|nr:MFS transporter [Chloroflexota bacterium]